MCASEQRLAAVQALVHQPFAVGDGGALGVFQVGEAKRTGRAMRLLVWPSGSVMWQPPAQGVGMPGCSTTSAVMV